MKPEIKVGHRFGSVFVRLVRMTRFGRETVMVKLLTAHESLDGVRELAEWYELVALRELLTECRAFIESLPKDTLVEQHADYEIRQVMPWSEGAERLLGKIGATLLP